MYAVDPAPPPGIRVDTAYVANDMHVELEYSVLVPFGKDHLSAYTSVDDHAARQNSNVPITLAVSPGEGKTSLPFDLIVQQATCNH